MSRIVSLLQFEANRSLQQFRHTCYKKVFVKQHFLQERRTQYTYLSTGSKILAPYRVKGGSYDVSQRIVFFGFYQILILTMPH